MAHFKIHFDNEEFCTQPDRGRARGRYPQKLDDRARSLDMMIINEAKKEDEAQPLKKSTRLASCVDRNEFGGRRNSNLSTGHPSSNTFVFGITIPEVFETEKGQPQKPRSQSTSKNSSRISSPKFQPKNLKVDEIDFQKKQVKYYQEDSSSDGLDSPIEEVEENQKKQTLIEALENESSAITRTLNTSNLR